MSIHFQDTAEQLDILGRAADFCPICRELRACTLRQSNLVKTHGMILVGIPTFSQVSSKLLGYDRVCETCNLDLPTVLEAYARILPAGGSETVATLIEQTNPKLPGKVEARLNLEQRIVKGDLQPEERRALLLEPFRLLDHRLLRVAGRPRPRWLTPTILGFGGVAILIIALDSVLPSDVRLVLRVLSILLVACFLLYWVGRGLRSAYRAGNLNRLMAVEIDPLLARGLKPLGPTEPEIHEILEVLRSEKLVSGRVLRPGRILAEMQCLR